MAILSIIAGVAVPQLGRFSSKARDARRVSDLKTVEAALEAYRVDFGTYPPAAGGANAWSGDAPSYGGYGYDASGYILGLVPEYIKELPRDPSGDNPQGGSGYLYRTNGTDYKFLAHQTAESFPTNHRFFDPRRPSHAYQVSSPGGAGW